MQVAVQKDGEEFRSGYYQKHSLPTAEALHSAAGESSPALRIATRSPHSRLRCSSPHTLTNV